MGKNSNAFKKNIYNNKIIYIIKTEKYRVSFNVYKILQSFTKSLQLKLI